MFSSRRGLRQSRRPADRRDHAAVPDEPVRRSNVWPRPCSRGWRAHPDPDVVLRYFNAAGASLDAAIGEDWTDAGNLVRS